VSFILPIVLGDLRDPSSIKFAKLSGEGEHPGVPWILSSGRNWEFGYIKGSDLSSSSLPKVRLDPNDKDFSENLKGVLSAVVLWVRSFHTVQGHS